jgi:hypothetical protein
MAKETCVKNATTEESSVVQYGRIMATVAENATVASLIR